MKPFHAFIAALAGLLALAPSAHAQDHHGQGFARNDGIELFSGYDYAGERRAFRGDVGNLRDYSFNDAALSVRVGRGLWLLCDNANFTGRCVTIDRDIANLNEIGLAGRVSSVRRTDAGDDYAGHRGGLYLYDDVGYRGRETQLSFASGNLAQQGANDAARSLRTDRPWLVCRDADFQGPCTVIEGDVPDTHSIGLFASISSARPYEGDDVQPGYPPPGGYPPDHSLDHPTATGRTAAFFARTQTPSCDTWGAATAQCVERTADEFCRAQGYREAAYFSVDRSRGRYQPLEDVLCVR